MSRRDISGAFNVFLFFLPCLKKKISLNRSLGAKSQDLLNVAEVETLFVFYLHFSSVYN